MPAEPIKILLIDDNDDDARIMQRMIEDIDRDNLIFRHYQDEDSAVAALDSEPFDMIFLDNRLTRLTGVELLSEIRARGHTLPVIYCSTLADPRITDDLQRLDCNLSIEKEDLDAATIESIINQVLNL